MQFSRNFSRQKVSPSDLVSVTIIGAGHLGSMIALALTQIGVGEEGLYSSLTVYDADTVGPENQPASFYRETDYGERKVFALRKNIEALNGVQIKPIPMEYEEQPLLDEVVILALDTLGERNRIWGIIKERFPNVKFVIDARSGKDIIEIFTTQDLERFERAMDLTQRVMPLDCSEKAVAYNAFTCAGVVCRIYAAHCRGEKVPSHVLIDHKSWALVVDFLQ